MVAKYYLSFSVITGFSVVQTGRQSCRWPLPCVRGSSNSHRLVKQTLHLHYWHQLIINPIGWPSCLLSACVSLLLKLWLIIRAKVICSGVQLGNHKLSYTNEGQTVKYDNVAVLTPVQPLPIYISQWCAVWTGGKWSFLSSLVCPTSEYGVEFAHV